MHFPSLSHAHPLARLLAARKGRGDDDGMIYVYDTYFSELSTESIITCQSEREREPEPELHPCWIHSFVSGHHLHHHTTRRVCVWETDKTFLSGSVLTPHLTRSTGQPVVFPPIHIYASRFILVFPTQGFHLWSGARAFALNGDSSLKAKSNMASAPNRSSRS
jgi:hypothetical protein